MTQKFKLFFLFFVVLWGTGHAASVQPELKVGFHEETINDLSCNQGTPQSVFEGSQVTLAFNTSGFPENAKFVFDYFLTQDGFSSVKTVNKYLRQKTNRHRLTLTMGKLLPFMDFGAVAILVEARDQFGNYASDQFAINVHRPFRLLRNPHGAFNCQDLSAGSVISSLYHNTTDTVVRVSVQDAYAEAFQDEYKGTYGVYFFVTPLIARVKLGGFTSGNEYVQRKLRNNFLWQASDAMRSLAPDRAGVLVRRKKTFYEQYELSEVNACGESSAPAELILHGALPSYEWMYVQNPLESVSGQLDMISLSRERSNCLRVQEDLEKREFMEIGNKENAEEILEGSSVDGLKTNL